MPTLYQSDFAKRVKPMPSGDDADILSQRAIIVPTATLAAADVGELLILPADHVPVDVILDVDKLDSNGAPTITLDIGMFSGTAGLNDATRTCGNEFAAAVTTAQAGGHVRANKMQGVRILPKTFDRGVGVKVVAGAATGVVSLTNLNVNRGLWQPGVAYTANDYVTLKNGIRVKCTTTGVSGVTDPFDGTVLYNVTVNDGTAVWTIADPYVALTLFYRPTSYGV